MLPSSNVIVLIVGIIAVIYCYAVITGVEDKIINWWKNKKKK